MRVALGMAMTVVYTAAIKPIPTVEWAALIDFYSATNGGTWSSNAGWDALLANRSCASAVGVTCNYDTAITHVR